MHVVPLDCDAVADDAQLIGDLGKRLGLRLAVHRCRTGTHTDQFGDSRIHRVVQRCHRHEVADRHVQERRQIHGQPVVGQVQHHVELCLMDAHPLPHRAQYRRRRHGDGGFTTLVLAADLQTAGDLMRPVAHVQRTRRGNHLDLMPQRRQAQHQAVQRQLDAAADAAAQRTHGSGTDEDVLRCHDGIPNRQSARVVPRCRLVRSPRPVNWPAGTA